MNYLFIVTESESANGICTAAVMKELVSNHEVYCLTNREWNAPVQYEKDGVLFYTVNPRLTYRLRSMLSHRKMPQTIKAVLHKAVFVLERCKLVLSLGSWPLLSAAYTRRIEKAARKICREKGIQCIVPIYTQIDTLIAARRIKKKQKDMLYIQYFLDSLSGGIRTAGLFTGADPKTGPGLGTYAAAGCRLDCGNGIQQSASRKIQCIGVLL